MGGLAVAVTFINQPFQEGGRGAAWDLVVTGDRAADGDSMTDLVEALRASVEAARDNQLAKPPDQQRCGA